MATVKLIAYVMRLAPSAANATVMFATRIDKKASQATKVVEYSSKSIDAHCDLFALEVSRAWNNTDTVPVSVMVDRDPTKRKPRGYDDRPRGHIINAPEGTIILG
jgi:glycerol-3-phosphate O-acyltransferase